MHKLEWQWNYRLTLQHFSDFGLVLLLYCGFLVQHNNRAAIRQVTVTFPQSIELSKATFSHKRMFVPKFKTHDRLDSQNDDVRPHSVRC